MKDAIGHAYSNPVFTWKDDGSACIATFTCLNDSTHIETVEATISSSVKTEATCLDNGTTTYTATVTFNGTEYTDTLDVDDIEAIGHDYDEPVFMWSDDGSTCVVMVVCQNIGAHIYVFGKDYVAITSNVKTEAT